jgi:hypothetical protein
MIVLLRAISIGTLAGTCLFRFGTPAKATTDSAAVAARTPARYRVSEYGPSTVAPDGRSITMRRTVSLVTVGARDSVGGSIWELLVDSSTSMIVPRDSTNPRTRHMQLGAFTPDYPMSYRAYIRDGRVIKTQVDGQTIHDPFATENPAWSLLTQLPPFASLPRSGLPARIDARVDTSASQRQLPSGLWYDTLVVEWRRTPAGVVDGTLTHRSQFINSPARRSERLGLVHIVLAADGSVVEARIEERSVAHPASGIVFGGDPHVSTITLIKGS